MIEKLKDKKVILAVAAVLVVLIAGLGFSSCGKDKDSVSDNSVVTLSVNQTQTAVSGDTASGSNTSSASSGTGDSQEAVNETMAQDPEDSTENASDNPSEEDTSSEQESTGETGTAVSVSVAESGTPVANHGELSLSGTQIVDKNGKPYQLKGVSTHGIAWFPEYINYDSFKTLRDEWGVNCIRLAMYSDEYGGYCSGGNQTNLQNLVKNGVSYATDLGMYVIIDWHVLGEGDPNVHKTEAIAFFSEMSALYADYDNVIYEICNEPNGGVTWSSVKTYAEEVIPVIKANNPDAIIIVGTPTWSQDVDKAAADPITGYSNIMYALHFYADTHKGDLRTRMVNALSSGLPIFVSEFGICDASGNGNINITEANEWMSVIDANGLSCCIWNLSNKAESSSLIKSSCSKTSGWTTDELSEEGQWYVAYLGGAATGSSSSGSTGSTTTTSTTSGSNSSSSSQTQSSAVTASADNTTVSVSQSGSWNDGNNNNYQFTVTISNTGSSAVKDWSVTVDFGSSVSIDQSWSGNFSLSGSSVTITPVDFNKEIAAGTSVEVGLIVVTSGSLGNPTVTLN